MADPVTVLVLREMRKQLYPQETLKIDALDTALAALALVQKLANERFDEPADRLATYAVRLTDYVREARALLAQETTHD